MAVTISRVVHSEVPEDDYVHAAFESTDVEALGAGAEWLQTRGWVKSWGIGRHVRRSDDDRVVIGRRGAAVEPHERDRRLAQLGKHFHVAGDHAQRLHVPARVAPELLAAEHDVAEPADPRRPELRGPRLVDADRLVVRVHRHRRRRLAHRRRLEAVHHFDEQAGRIAQAHDVAAAWLSALLDLSADATQLLFAPRLDGEAEELVVRSRLHDQADGSAAGRAQPRVVSERYR